MDIQVPVVLPDYADDYISSYGTATLYLEYDASAAFGTAASTATTTLVSGTERYEFDLSGVDPDYWYRARVGEGDESTFEAYFPAFQVPVAYATLQEVTRGMDFPDTSRYPELESLLVEATDYVTNVVCGGRSFFRDPVGSGDTTLTLDIPHRWQPTLSLARGRDLDIISLTSVGIGDYSGDTYTTITEGTSGYLTVPDVPRTGWPYTDIVLSDFAAYTSFPPGYRTVQLVGAFGWSTVPDLVRRATVDLVRFWWNGRQSDGDPVGVSAFGAPIFGPGTPKTVRELARSNYAWKQWAG